MTVALWPDPSSRMAPLSCGVVHSAADWQRIRLAAGWRWQEKRSSYAPKEEEGPVRYDGIYRIASCWRSKGAQGYLVCRYLFIRCDNSPAPWSSEGA